MREITSVATKGSWVMITMNTRAGMRGARRAQAAARSRPAGRTGTGRTGVRLRTFPEKVLDVPVMAESPVPDRSPDGRRAFAGWERRVRAALAGDAEEPLLRALAHTVARRPVLRCCAARR